MKAADKKTKHNVEPLTTRYVADEEGIERFASHAKIMLSKAERFWANRLAREEGVSLTELLNGMLETRFRQELLEREGTIILDT